MSGKTTHRSFKLTSESGSRFLLIVVSLAIAVLLLGVACPFPAHPIKEGARRAACANNVRQIALACLMYAADNDEYFPNRLEQLYPEYLDKAKVFSCPSSYSSYRDFETGKITPDSSSYTLIPGLRSDMPGGTILLYERSDEHHDGEGRNAGYVDSRVQWHRKPQEGTFEDMLKEQEERLKIWHKQQRFSSPEKTDG
jgi:hypothetical protein